jgi:ribosomal-protein-alanine N-acetyltransferase
VQRPRVELRRPGLADAGAVAGLYAGQRAFLAPFDPVRREDFYTEAGQLAVLAESEERERLDQGYRFLILADGRLAGTLGISNVSRGAFQSATLGYFVAKELNGRGVATGAVGLALEWAFGEAGLHRLQAGTLLDNVGSQRVLDRNGFRILGISYAHLQIHGAWCDHVIFERTRERAWLDPEPVERRVARLFESSELV